MQNNNHSNEMSAEFVIENMLEGYSYNKIILDDHNTPVDFVIIETNPVFEKMVGLKKENIVLKRASEVLKVLKASKFDWISVFGKIALTGKKLILKRHFEVKDRSYRVSVFSNKYMYFTVIYQDITETLKAEKILKENEERLSYALEGSGYGIWDWDIQKNQVYYSGRWKRMLGYEEDEIGTGIEELFLRVHPDDLSRVMNSLNKHFDGKRYSVEYRIRCKNGQYKWMLTNGKVVKWDEKGTPIRMVGTHYDITAKKIFEEEMKKVHEEQSLLLDNIDSHIWYLKNPRTYGAVNKAHADFLGLDKNDIEDKDIFEINSAEIAKVLLEENERAFLLHEKTITEQIMLDKNGKEVLFELIRIPKLDENNNVEYVICRGENISERKKQEEEIRYLSFHDNTTDLYNRYFFNEELKRLDTKRQLPISLIIGDVNGLKLTNDVFGHNEGDNLLRRIASIIRNCCRKEDIIARWGGDEYGIILPKTDEKKVKEICERIKRTCEDTEYEPIKLSISLGYATKHSEDEAIIDTFCQAENIMYREKLVESRNVHEKILNILQKRLFERSHETKEHCERIKDICQQVGKILNMSSQDIDKIGLLGLTHDIGKVAIDENILIKSHNLSEAEWEIMKKHSVAGYRIANLTRNYAHIAEEILYHHERWDGKGYPQGLKGEQIPLMARILSVADAYVTMTSDNIYRKALSNEEALQEIQKCSETQFDPKIVELFVKLRTGVENTIDN